MKNSTASLVDPVSPLRFACHVVDVTSLNAHTSSVALQSSEDVALHYLAGHYLKLDLDVNGDGKPVSLSYSIANSPDLKHPRRLQLIIQKTSDFVGKVLQLLSQNVGRDATVDVTLPMGQSYLQTDLGLPHILVAAGSGISKIKCLAEAIVQQRPDAEVQIYWSNKAIDDFYLLDDLQSLADQCDNLTFTPILEADDANWSGRFGYIYKVIQADFDNLEGSQFYLCGSPQMVYGTIDQLQPLGLQEDQCYSDAFEYAPRP